MDIKRLDHLVLTVNKISDAIFFYHHILGMELIHFGKNNERTALKFGQQKINLHEVKKEIIPHAKYPLSGSADLCFITNTPIQDVIKVLNKNNIEVELGPVERTGTMHQLNSIYCRDPDGNLIEIANEML